MKRSKLLFSVLLFLSNTSAFSLEYTSFCNSHHIHTNKIQNQNPRSTDIDSLQFRLQLNGFSKLKRTELGKQPSLSYTGLEQLLLKNHQ